MVELPIQGCSVAGGVQHSPEIWADCYHGRYEVSNHGNVRNSGTRKILSPGKQSRGYLTVNLYDGSSPKRPRSHCVHNLVMLAFVGAVPTGWQINHLDGDKTNNTLWNLEYCTQTHNMRHAVDFLGNLLGESNPNCKLSNAHVADIRSAPSSVSHTELANKYGVSVSYVGKLRKGHHRKDVVGTLT